MSTARLGQADSLKGRHHFGLAQFRKEEWMRVFMRRRWAALAVTVLVAPLSIVTTPASAKATTTSPFFGLQKPAIGVNNDGRIEIFAIDTQGQLWHRWENSRGSGAEGTSGFSGWRSIGSANVHPPAVVASRVEGDLEVFARGIDRGLKRIHPADVFAGWTSLGGVFDSAPSAAVSLGGRISVYVRGLDDRAWAFTESGVNTDQYSVSSIPGGTFQGDPVATRRSGPHGDIEVYVRGMDSRLYYFEDNPTGVYWHYNVGGQPMNGTPAIGYDLGNWARAFLPLTASITGEGLEGNQPADPWSHRTIARGVQPAPSAVRDPATHQAVLYARPSNDTISLWNGTTWTRLPAPLNASGASTPTAVEDLGVHHIAATLGDGTLGYCRKPAGGGFICTRL